MSSRRHLLALCALAAVLVLGLTFVFQRRLARDLYPPYSSFRADPLGTRALHDALALLPGRQVSRSLAPLEQLAAQPERTLLFAGVDRDAWTSLNAEPFAAIDGALRHGSRVVLALVAEHHAPTTEQEKDAAERAKLKEERLARERQSRPAPEKPEPPANKDKSPAPPKDRSRPPPVDAFSRWGFAVEVQRDHGGKVEAGPGLAIALPENLPWRSSLVVAPVTPADWSVVVRRDDRALVAERRVGLGTLVVVTDAYLVSNEALQRTRATALLAHVVGELPEIVFVESHLGVVEDPGIAALARRYGLMPAFALCALLALLQIWRLAAAFVPPPPAPEELALDYRPTSSLAALLRRAVPRKQLLPTCLDEWRRTASPADLARVEAALAAHTDPVAGYNAAVEALRRRTRTPAPKP